MSSPALAAAAAIAAIAAIDRSEIRLQCESRERCNRTGLTMRVVAIILALAAGASGCPCSSTFGKEECEDCLCEWQDQCEGGRRNLRFGAADTGCCTYPDCCLDPTNVWCDRRLTEEEMAALTEEEQEHRRLSCP